MNEYMYKPKLKSSLPKLPLTTATTYHTTFYSNQSKTKSNSVYNYRKLIDINENNVIYNSKKNESNLYLKTERNYINEKIKKNKKRKIKPFLLVGTELSDAETDDTIFALSEIRNMDNKIAKRVKKNLIWKEKTNNIYDIVTSKNRNDIKNIKNKVRHNLSGMNSKLKKEIYKNKYFPEEKINTINEVQNIISKVKNNLLQERKINKKFMSFNKIDLHTFTRQNRDICLKNIFIDLIKDESNKIKTKEIQINKALEEAKLDFLKDKHVFEQFKNNKKRAFKEQEFQLEESIKKNKLKMEQLKKCSSELHGTKDEIDKNIKDIILYKEYANFVHQIIPKDKKMENVNMDKIDFINKDKDFEIVSKNIIEEFSFLLDDFEFPFHEDLNNPQLLTTLFNRMESNILNSMEERDLTIKEIIRNRKKYEKELEILKNKIDCEKKELENVNQEIIGQKNIISPKRDYQHILEENEKYILIIYNELNKLIKQKKSNQNINICTETLNLLHQIEDKLLILFCEMDRINIMEKENHSDEVFKNIIDKVKYDNKIDKYFESREISLKLQEEKNRKYEQRMNRYKRRGPFTYPPPWAIKKSKERNMVKRDKKKDDDDILYY